jgi:hypothetical protein
MLKAFASWQEFKPSNFNQQIHSNFNIDSNPELVALLSTYKAASTDNAPTHDKPQTAQLVAYELGDHADDAIAALSATRKKAIPIEEHFDDCGDDTTSLELPEVSAFQYCFHDCVDEIASKASEESDPDDEMFAGSFFCSHFWGSDYCTPMPPTCSFTQAYQTVMQPGSIDFFEMFGGEGGCITVVIRRCKLVVKYWIPALSIQVISTVLLCPLGFLFF